jgi:SAM-dependent methyltransferase
MTVCASCGAWFVWPAPTLASIQAHYQASTAGMPRQLREWRSGTVQNRWYEALAGRIARRSRDFRTIVDVGAGAMELSCALAQEFENARIESWDLFEDGMPPVPAKFAERLSAHRADVNRPDEALHHRLFDLVVCVAVIEHVIDPSALLQLLRSITAPGGVLYVVGPEVTSPGHRVLRARWPYYAPDDHLTLPSLESIRRTMVPAGGSCELRRINVKYSLRYLLRFLRFPLRLPAAMDLMLPVPAGAFELIWTRD